MYKISSFDKYKAIFRATTFSFTTNSIFNLGNKPTHTIWKYNVSQKKKDTRQNENNILLFG